MSDRYDVIVIGSGIGGLAIGSLLSSDRKVLVLEKNNVFGGYCSDFVRGGFRFESSVQAINGLSAGDPIYEVLEKSGALDSVKILKPKELYRAVFPGHDITVPQDDIIGYKKALSRLFPEEESGIAGLFGTMESIYHEMRRFHVEKTLKKSPHILKYGRLSLEKLLDEFIKDYRLKAIISQYWIYRGLPPTKLAATTFSYIWYDYSVNGSYYPEGGMSRIVNNLIATIKDNKGDVMARGEVSRLRAKGDRITSLELKSGTKLEADTYISNIDAYATLGMIDGADADIGTFVDDLKDNAISISAVKIYLGLDIDVKELGVRDYEIFFNPSYDSESMYKAAVNNDFAGAPCSITIYSNLPGATRPGAGSTVSIGLLSGYDYWRGLSRSEYLKNKESMADIVLSRCEAILPGLRKHIKTKVIATPLTMERYTGNSLGSIYGWNKKSLADEIKFMSPTTPIRNLFLSSHWTKIGGGIGGVLLSADRVFNLLKAGRSNG